MCDQPQITNGTHAADDVLLARYLCLPRHRRELAQLDGNHRRSFSDSIRGPYLQARFPIPNQLSLRSSGCSLQDTHISSKCGLLRQDLLGHSQGQVERRLQCSECTTQRAESAGRAKQVSGDQGVGIESRRSQEANHLIHSASPLNGQAAELWNSDPAEYKRMVLARHQDIDLD